MDREHPPIEPPSYAPDELRGVIIVDTNILYNLYAGVPGEYKVTTPPAGHKTLRRYLDALRVLSQHGYEVIIPEMVSYEAENIISTGNDVDSYFPRDDESRNKPYRSELKRFLHDAAGGKRYPHIKIMPNYEPQDVADFLGAVHNIVDHEDKPSPHTTRRLVSLQRKNRKHYGDKAIAAMLSHDDGVRSFSKHVFVLSDDREVIRNASQYPDVNVLNTMGFIDGMINSGLWEGLGLNKDADVRDVMKDIGTQLALANGHEDMGYYANTDYRADDYRRYLDRDLQGTRVKPFADSLHQMVTDLGWDHRFDMDTVEGERRMSRIEQFRRRYGYDWHERQNADQNPKQPFTDNLRSESGREEGQQGIGGR